MIEIEVTGDTEFLAGLAQLADLTDAVVIDSELFAAKTVVDAARPEVPVVTGAAAHSLRVLDYGGGAAATGGSSAVPYYGWLEFGGDAGIRRSVHRPVVPLGRYLHPAFLQNFDKIERKMGDLLEDAIDEARLS